MGAKDWMLLYGEGDIRATLRASPPIDRDATHDFVAHEGPYLDDDPCLDDVVLAGFAVVAH